MRVKAPIKTKPEYAGSKMWRTSNDQKYKCVRCKRFATHVGFYVEDAQRIYMCPTHSRIFTTSNIVHRIEPLLEYKKYLADTQQWNEQQQTAEQGVLL